VTALKASPGDEGVVSMTMPGTSGSLRLVLPGVAQGQANTSDFSSPVLLNDRGAMVPLNLLTGMGVATETAVQGSTAIIIPTVASGAWRVARFAGPREMLQGFSGWATPLVIRTFNVPAGRSVVVDLR
jgi:hypothetical protein